MYEDPRVQLGAALAFPTSSAVEEAEEDEDNAGLESLAAGPATPAVIRIVGACGASAVWAAGGRPVGGVSVACGRA